MRERVRDSMEEDPAEQENLISHHLESDDLGRPVIRSVPTWEDGGVQDEERGETIEQKVDAQMNTNDDIDKTGRPEWLENISRLPPRTRHLIVVVGFGVLLVLAAGAFYFSMEPTEAPEPEYKPPHPTTTNVDGLHKFPTSIGYPGTYATGAPPEYAQYMRPAPSKTRGVSPIQTNIPNFGDKFNPFHHMGPLSPYYSASFGGVDNAKYLVTPSTSKGVCTLAQVHILHRHGSRYPTTGAPTELVRQFLKEKKGTLSFDGPLAFLNTYTYRQGRELLVPLGRQQLHMSGVKAAIDYGMLAEEDLNKNKRLFVRTGSQQRIVDSALAWATGFWGNSWVDKTDFEVQIEEPHFNTTMAPNFACNAAADAFRIQDYADKYLGGAIERLQQHVKGGTLTPMVLHGMQQLCAYDTVAFGNSEFCSLFTEQEWLAYEYTWDRKFYDLYGPGSPVGPAMGLGWLNELISRMTRTPWNIETQSSENTTFNTDPLLFPLDRAIYADFTHDSVLTSVIAAMRFSDLGKLPSLDDKQRAFRSSLVVPFSARMVFEVFDCKGSLDNKDAHDTSYVRMKLNDAIVPLKQLSQCEDRPDGLCSMDKFLASHADRNEQGWWARCQV
ncbi:hypothetical protein MVES1_000012 [Malassezia vespertilionis]|uniref:Acid phosphatase n=1 Tax=Malassezia vespertilionis TaxID=2020962 RepID=A0A2N1JGJ8_9BASI|nr:uncharacterized protein MVES1_000012 [Malassezia vespertilionis]PKI85666.1 hypothetical protein MVES_000012 [Malassezia vespertilionis]WFD04689.1 hypothetical protein MVES1_000012 [Malassezia vespertilionis]